MTKAKIAKTPRACGWCGVDISARRGATQYCSLQHKRNAASKRHRERNPSYYRDMYRQPGRAAYMKAYLERRRGELNAYGRAYYRRNADVRRAVTRKWFQENPVKHRAYQANRRARKINNPGSLHVHPREIDRILRTKRCFYCLTFTADLQVDHVVPLVRGGRHAIGNLVAACKSCNSSKRARFVTEMKRKGERFPWSIQIRREECLSI